MLLIVTSRLIAGGNFVGYDCYERTEGEVPGRNDIGDWRWERGDTSRNEEVVLFFFVFFFV
jgi:hypothetical protein